MIAKDDHGRRWSIENHGDLVTVGVCLDAPPVRYRHDGAGGILFTGGLRLEPHPVSVEWAMSRLEPLEERRAWAARPDNVMRPEEYDTIIASLLEALQQAERFRMLETVP